MPGLLRNVSRTWLSLGYIPSTPSVRALFPNASPFDRGSTSGACSAWACGEGAGSEVAWQASLCTEAPVEKKEQSESEAFFFLECDRG